MKSKTRRNRDFVIFQKEFEKWQQRFGLNGYKVYFRHAPLENCFAQISYGDGNMVVTVTYNSDIPENDQPFSDPRTHAKHEALHLLVNRLDRYGRSRFVTDNQIYEAGEELVRRLETLIP